MTSNPFYRVVRPVAGLATLLAATSLAWAQSTPVVLNLTPTRVLGHVKLNQNTQNPNLIEGREVYAPQSVAIDTSTSPPIVYIADTGNNRVLAFKNANSLTKGNAADKVIGQRDLQSTLAQGPSAGSGALSTGLSSPTAVAVDKSGNLYVVDVGNQRILRYPKPLSQTGDLLAVDLVIGQRAAQSGFSPNEGNQLPSAKTVYFTLSSSLTLDPQGNLWVTDSNNNRVLRFPLANLTPNLVEPAADVVIGQIDFVTRTQPTPPQNVQAILYKGSAVFPSGIAFDSTGRLYVADGYQRVLYYTPPFNTGAFAQRLLGVQVQISGQPAPTLPNAISLNNGFPIQGLLNINNNLFVCDPGANRIVRYDPPETWAAESETVPSPTMKGVVGQSGFQNGKANRGDKEPSANSLNLPIGMAYSGTELWVADNGNNRVISFPLSTDLTPQGGSRLVGQIDYQYFAPNLVEGRELYVYAGNSGGFPTGGSGVAIDRNSNPPRLYIADSLNNRVLGYADARKVRPGDKADLVIGQADLFHTLVNSPTGDTLLPTDTGLFNPTGLAVDDKGNLWVADLGNGRVLRFPSPFAQSSPSNQKATLVLGQSGFFTKVTDAGVANMRSPYGLALLLDGSIAASDVAHNRVLVFRRPNGGDLSNGQSAAVVYGQPDFTSSGAGTVLNLNRFFRPLHIATDTDDRLYVADNGNNRVMVFTRIPQTGSNISSTLQITGFNGVSGMTISPLTGELWAADTFNSRVLRFPQYDTLSLNPQTSTYNIPTPGPLALGLDAFDNLVVVDASNRAGFYYQAMIFQNSANFGTRSLTPGMFSYMYRLGRPFDNWDSTKDPASKAWSTTVGDVQLLVDGVASPIYELIPGRIDFVVPVDAVDSGTSEFIVQKASTGQILGVGTFPMNVADPGLYANNGSGPLAANNQDGSVNGPGSAGAARGSIVILYGTGQGRMPNIKDGIVPNPAVSTPVKPRVVFQGVVLKDEDIQYSGSSFFPGGWQLHIKVPDPQAVPGQPNQVAITMYDIPSNRGPNGPIVTTIYVK